MVFSWDELEEGKEEEEEGKEVVPYRYRFEEEWEKPPEEPPTIEGEFREVPLGEPVAPGVPEDRERAKKEREAAEYAEKLERARAGAAMAKFEREKLMAEERKVGIATKRAELRKKKAQEVGRIAGGIAKLAGFGYKASLVRHRELYIPRPTPEMYFGGEGRKTLREVTMPRLGRLREAGALETGAPRPEARTPLLEARTRMPPAPPASVPRTEGLVSVRGQTVALGLMRRMTMPRGLMPVERYAYGEIAGNGDRDTFRHVVSELAAIGVSRKDAEQAIKSLLAKGVVKQTREFAGEEPVLEIAQ